MAQRSRRPLPLPAAETGYSHPLLRQPLAAQVLRWGGPGPGLLSGRPWAVAGPRPLRRARQPWAASPRRAVRLRPRPSPRSSAAAAPPSREARGRARALGGASRGRGGPGWRARVGSPGGARAQSGPFPPLSCAAGRTALTWFVSGSA